MLATLLAAAAASSGCAPGEEGVELSVLDHAHADHAHVSVPEHAPHTHGATADRRERTRHSALELVDIEGVDHGTLAAPTHGRWTSLFFVRTDCPIANRYAPEIRRICADYAAAGLECLLVYVDGHLTAEDVREHADAFDLALPAILDRDHALVAHAGATVTPEAAVFASGAELKYRGRIDNLYAELGRPRVNVTERDLRSALDDLVAGRSVHRSLTQATGCYIE
jgi:hypothetical protein